MAVELDAMARATQAGRDIKEVFGRRLPGLVAFRLASQALGRLGASEAFAIDRRMMQSEALPISLFCAHVADVVILVVAD